MTDANIIKNLKNIAGRRHVLTRSTTVRPYTKGYRVGGGQVLAVVRPGSLVEFWRVLQECVAQDVIVIMQAANTGLTGGSTPDGSGYDRDIILINTMRMDKIYTINEGRQVVCLPGSTLHQLERILKPLGRDPHSVIGSSCIGASVIGGVCNNSGGTLIQRGPAYTEMALYAQLDDRGELRLVNHLGIALGNNAEAILSRLDQGDFSASDIAKAKDRQASDTEYCDHVRQIDADTAARFNADKRRLFETSGSAGRVAVFAVRLDSFEKQGQTKMFYIGTNDVGDLTQIRRDILGGFKHLPVSGEYMNAEAYDIAETYGRDIFMIIDRFGTEYLPHVFKIKGWIDDLSGKIGLKNISDRIMQSISRILPNPLPKRMRAFRTHFDQYLMINMAGDAAQDEMRLYLQDYFKDTVKGDWFECDDDEARRAGLHRFAAAGAGIRYQAVHADKIQDMIALDIALRRNDRDWFENLPPDIEQAIESRLYYGHFFCHVFHQDYLIKKGYDVEDIKNRMLEYHDSRGAEYPAEHNVGHAYFAKPSLESFYRDLDPTNSFNPGIGKTSKKKNWISD